MMRAASYPGHRLAALCWGSRRHWHTEPLKGNVAACPAGLWPRVDSGNMPGLANGCPAGRGHLCSSRASLRPIVRMPHRVSWRHHLRKLICFSQDRSNTKRLRPRVLGRLVMRLMRLWDEPFIRPASQDYGSYCTLLLDMRLVSRLVTSIRYERKCLSRTVLSTGTCRSGTALHWAQTNFTILHLLERDNIDVIIS